jgi:hypothetical protein
MSGGFSIGIFIQKRYIVYQEWGTGLRLPPFS